VEDNFAEVVVSGMLSLQDSEGDRLAVEGGEFGGHVMVVYEKLLVGLGNLQGGNPNERHRAKE